MNYVGTLFVKGFESHVLFDSGASNYFITPKYAESSGIRSSAGEHSGLVKVAGGSFLSTSGRARAVDVQIAGHSMPPDLVISPIGCRITGSTWIVTEAECPLSGEAERLTCHGVRPTSGESSDFSGSGSADVGARMQGLFGDDFYARVCG